MPATSQGVLAEPFPAATAGPLGVPHWLQKRAVAGRAAPHCRQAPACMGDPQELQKRPELSAPQDGHVLDDAVMGLESRKGS